MVKPTINLHLLQQPDQQGVVELDKEIIAFHQDRLQLVLIVKEIGGSIVGRYYCTPVPDVPGFLIADADIAREGVVAMRADNRNGEYEWAIACGDDGSVTKSLFWESLAHLNGGLPATAQVGHIECGRQVGGGEGRVGAFHLLFAYDDGDHLAFVEEEVDVAFSESDAPLSPVLVLYILFVIIVGHHQLHEGFLVKVEDLFAK